MPSKPSLPARQRVVDEWPRFGLTPFAERFPDAPERASLEVFGEVEAPGDLTERLGELERVSQVSDLHCVTTWSHLGIRWSGYRFRDVYDRLIRPVCRPRAEATFLQFRCQDGYRVCLHLEDALAPDVLLADRLDDAPIPIAHGAPLRLVAPAHYGYKNAKHVKAIEFCATRYPRPASLPFLDHPRARVAHEERGRYFPGWLLAMIYRPMIPATRRLFAAALDRHQASREERLRGSSEG